MRRARSTSGPALPRRALPQERGEGRVRQGQAVDDDPVALEADRGVERDDGVLPCPGHVGPTRDI